jgi:pseudouridine-5'-phosphate glycosidase
MKPERSPQLPVCIASEVRHALANRGPVVALESTVIAHGLPRPRNLETALALEDEVRAAGAVPATIAVLGGVPTVGLNRDEVEQLATNPDVRKCSRRDLPLAMARGETGATTVSATMVLARLAGIEVFATGGIGGVHRDHPHDVSADLDELGRTPVTVVCAGAKSILDLPLTLEALETRGVPVIGFGTDTFPAFYARSSGLRVDQRCDTLAEVAAVVAAHRRLGLDNGLLVAVPISEQDQLPDTEAKVATALAQAEAQGIRGKALTPFLLQRMVELTAGRSLEANVALLRQNVRIAAGLTLELVKSKGTLS